MTWVSITVDSTRKEGDEIWRETLNFFNAHTNILNLKRKSGGFILNFLLKTENKSLKLIVKAILFFLQNF